MNIPTTSRPPMQPAMPASGRRPAMSDMEVRATALAAAVQHLGPQAHLANVEARADMFATYIRTGRLPWADDQSQEEQR